MILTCLMLMLIISSFLFYFDITFIAHYIYDANNTNGSKLLHSMSNEFVYKCSVSIICDSAECIT